MDKSKSKYFLAANSCEGFVSYFKNCYSAEKGWKAFIIKGGPGTGKSSFMKYVAARAEEKGADYELFPCSSDPDSLDAIILKDKKTVIMDGTAPHTVDPDFPGICETILNFGEFWQKEKLEKEADKILKATKKNKKLHITASRYIKAVGNLMEDNLKTANFACYKDKINRFADSLCRKHIPQGNGEKYEWIRFFTGITPKGVVFYGNSVINSLSDSVIIEDEFGSVSNIIISKVRDYALTNGYEIITVKNAFLPTSLTDAVIIPSLSFGIFRESEYGHFGSDIRRIHARRFINNGQLHKSRERIKFNKKAEKKLLSTACMTLSEAKTVHDEMEKYYISAMNFNSLTEFASDFTEKLFKD